MDGVHGSFVVVHAHYVGGDTERTWWLLQAGEVAEIFTGEQGKPDAHDVFVRRIGGEVRVSRHFADGHREFWDAMNAALPELGVRTFEDDVLNGLRPGWRENGRFGFYAYVKEVHGEG